ncbi:MAG: hypothetical protein IJ446_09020 [Oscillospiraceae bacterium]|nr:hypothetical protein [Oscillospiraceae bacterium]
MIYVIQTETGKENNICANLIRSGISAYVPRRELIVRKNAGWTKVINLLFPGYVFVDVTEVDSFTYYTVKSTSGVIRFLGEPTPIAADEEPFMRIIINNGAVIPESTAVVSGDKITVTGGWLKGKEQYVRYWNVRQKKAGMQIILDNKPHKFNVGVEYSVE